MKIELKEHELERALEVYLQGLYNKTVTVTGFDLSGMRSKDGLSAMIDIEIDGETNVRAPKVDSPNVKPTNTSWRNQEPVTEPEPETTYVEHSEEYFEVLRLLSINPKNVNREKIEALINTHEHLVKELENVSYYQNWLELCAKTDAEQEVTTLEPEEPKEEITQPVIITSDNNQEHEVTPFELSEPEEVEPEIQEELTVGEEIKEELKQSLFGSPLNKPVRKLFS